MSRQHAKRRLKIYCIDSKIAQLDGMPFTLRLSKLRVNALKDLWPTSVISHSILWIFPTWTKIANVIPIYKNSEEYFFTNYRPVSVLPFFSKVWNTHVPFINKHILLYDGQFGFRENSSTAMALITIIDQIIESLERGDHALEMFLDFSKVFDTVDHSTLLLQTT